MRLLVVALIALTALAACVAASVGQQMSVGFAVRAQHFELTAPAQPSFVANGPPLQGQYVELEQMGWSDRDSWTLLRYTNLEPNGIAEFGGKESCHAERVANDVLARAGAKPTVFVTQNTSPYTTEAKFLTKASLPKRYARAKVATNGTEVWVFQTYCRTEKDLEKWDVAFKSFRPFPTVNTQPKSNKLVEYLKSLW
jgi:hypothetical protein